MKKPKISPRKPPAPSAKPQSPADFIRGKAEAAPKNERVTVYVSPAVLLKAEHLAVDMRLSMSALAERALALAVKHPEMLSE